MSEKEEEGCCNEEGTCPDCQESAFTTSFYFDKHKVQITGCSTAVGEAEAILGRNLIERIPKLKEHANG